MSTNEFLLPTYKHASSLQFKQTVGSGLPCLLGDLKQGCFLAKPKEEQSSPNESRFEEEDEKERSGSAGPLLPAKVCWSILNTENLSEHQCHIRMFCDGDRMEPERPHPSRDKNRDSQAIP